MSDKKELKAVFFDFGGTIDLYPYDRNHTLEAVGKMLSVLKEAGIDLTGNYTPESFLGVLKERHGRYKKWRNKTNTELSGLKVWRDYILYDEPDKDKLNAETAEELTFLIETGLYFRKVRPEMKAVMDEITKTGLQFWDYQ